MSKTRFFVAPASCPCLDKNSTQKSKYGLIHQTKMADVIAHSGVRTCTKNRTILTAEILLKKHTQIPSSLSQKMRAVSNGLKDGEKKNLCHFFHVKQAFLVKMSSEPLHHGDVVRNRPAISEVRRGFPCPVQLILRRGIPGSGGSAIGGERRSSFSVQR